MDDLAGEVLLALEVRREAFVVAVVAAAGPEVVAGDGRALAAVGPLDVDRPTGLLARPLGAHGALPEADPAVDAAVARGLPHVLEYRGTVGDRLRVRPRPEAVAERVHVGVGTDARVAEEVPGPPQVLTRLEDRVAATGEGLLQVVGGADARKAGADDQHVEMLAGLSVRRQSTGILAGWPGSQFSA